MKSIAELLVNDVNSTHFFDRYLHLLFVLYFPCLFFYTLRLLSSCNNNRYLAEKVKKTRFKIVVGRCGS